MTEGRVYVTTWSRTLSGRYRVWVKRNKKLAAEGATFDEADRALWEVIGLATGDGENTHQYVPAPPDLESAGDAERAKLWGLGAGGRATMVTPDGLFAGGLCDNCLQPRGSRTAQPLELSSVDSGSAAASVSLPSKNFGPKLRIYSEEFVALLTPAERSSFEWRPVAPSKRRKRLYYERIDFTAPVPLVSAIGRTTYYARCGECGWTWLVPKYDKTLPMFMLSERELANPIPSMFAFGDGPEAQLAVTPTRWDEMAGTPGTKGITAMVVSVIAEDAVDRAPVYKSRAREEWKGRR